MGPTTAASRNAKVAFAILSQTAGIGMQPYPMKFALVPAMPSVLGAWGASPCNRLQDAFLSLHKPIVEATGNKWDRVIQSRRGVAGCAACCAAKTWLCSESA